MINEISISEILNKIQEDDKNQPSIFPRISNPKYFLLPFYFDGKQLQDSDDFSAGNKKDFFPRWGMTLLSAGTMRFRWNEENQNRKKIFDEILSEIEKTRNDKAESEKSLKNKKIVPLELIHSKIIVEAKNSQSTKNLKADGIISKNPDLIPTVTVADCVPIFLYDAKNGAKGIFHSGWKGTGIAETGVKKMNGIFGSKPENICAAIGPHIEKCCYCIDEERAEYFSRNFGEKCVSKRNLNSSKDLKSDQEDFESEKKFPYSLSLAEANLFVLKKAGIREENIVTARDCTCCSKFSSGRNIFGSFRRQAAFLPDITGKEEKSKRMTVQAAFII